MILSPVLNILINDCFESTNISIPILFSNYKSGALSLVSAYLLFSK